MAPIPRKNNLDWLRLGFAVQVMLMHTAAHLDLQIPGVLQHFPGVPAFFFISGLLIYSSYTSAPANYFSNRFLRLFPGLLAVTLGGLAILLMARGGWDLFEHGLQYTLWFVAQITLGQAYNPALFRGVGVGAINGALWTITTEVLFYISIPVIVKFERHIRHLVAVVTVMCFVIYSVGPDLLDQIVYRDKTAYDVLSLTPVPWGWMFGLGILTSKYFSQLSLWFRYFPLAAIPLLSMIALDDGVLFSTSGTRLGPLYFVAFAALILWAGFNTRAIRIPDISYGVYLWHMPVINLMLVFGMTYGYFAVVLTFMFAVLSYQLVERPALGLKARLHPRR